jgi:hypothetical protein
MNDLDLARSLIQRGEYDAARRVLLPLASTSALAADWLHKLDQRFPQQTYAQPESPSTLDTLTRFSLGCISLLAFVGAAGAFCYTALLWQRNWEGAALVAGVGAFLLLVAYLSRRFRP